METVVSINKLFVSKVLSLFVAAMLFVLPAGVPLSNLHAPKASAQSVAKFHQDILQLKVADNSGITVQNNSFVGDNAEVGQLNAILDNAGKSKIEKLKVDNSQNALQQKLDTALSGYYRIKLHQRTDVQRVASELKNLVVVTEAYAEPTAAPAPGKPTPTIPSTSYVNLQTYLNPTPNGIDSNYAKTVVGGTGNRVSIYDIEYSWNIAHEDILKSRTALIANGTPSDPFNDNNHGTAVIGSMSADDNSFGVTGAASGATLKLINANNLERGYDLVNALNLAAASAAAGDVVLIEQQTWGPTADTYDYVPVEWIPAVYDAIKALTTAGVNVIEAAGNGNQNLDDTSYYGTSFPAGKADSGAIIVGAGQNCSGTARLSRMDFSTYGSRVNLQGPGECVTTAGYGDLLSSRGVNAYYSSNFNGTSSASPIVAAAVASVSSIYETRNNSAPSISYVRNLLSTTGTAQNVAVGTLTGKIGSLPNLKSAIDALTGSNSDTTAPTIPQNLTVRLNTSGKPVLTWNAATDNTAVAGYRIYRNGVLYGTTTSLTFTDTSVAKRTSYTYQVVAIDGAGNQSAKSNSATVTSR